MKPSAAETPGSWRRRCNSNKRNHIYRVMKQIDTQSGAKLSISAAPANHEEHRSCLRADPTRDESNHNRSRCSSCSAISIPCTNLDS